MEVIAIAIVGMVAIVILPFMATTAAINKAAGDPIGQSSQQTQGAIANSTQDSSKREPKKPQTKSTNTQALEFVRQNRDDLLIDMAGGGGEYLTTLALLEGCRETSIPRLAEILQQNYYRVETSTPEAVLRVVENKIEADPALSAVCSGRPLPGLATEPAAGAAEISARKFAEPQQSLTGSYTSKTTSQQFSSRGLNQPKVTLQQDGEKITGTLTDPDGRLWGEIEGNEVRFDWALQNGSMGIGRWIVSADGTTLTGNWTSGARNDGGTWNLTRVDESDMVRPVKPQPVTVPSTTDIDAGSTAPPAGEPGPVSIPDIAGDYQVRVSRRPPQYWCFNERKRFHIELTQQDGKIQGSFGSGIDGKISGYVTGERIHFGWYTARCPAGGDGEWILDEDGSGLQGKSELGFVWTLIRDE